MHDRRHHFKGVCTQGDIIPPKMQLLCGRIRLMTW